MSTPSNLEPLRPHTPRRGNPAKRRTILRWSKRGALIVVAGAAAGALLYAWLPKPLAVDVAAARRGPLEVVVEEDGRTRVRDLYVVAAPISGTLARIELEPGDALQRGAAIARIEPPDPGLLDERSRSEAAARLAAAVAQHRAAEAAVAGARSARDAAKRDGDRARGLEARAIATAAERDRAELAEELARQELTGAERRRDAAAAEVTAARAVLHGAHSAAPGSRHWIVRAPASGRVLRLARDSEGPVLAGEPLLEVGDPAAMEVVVDVLSSDAARIRPGMPVSIVGWGGEGALPGRVERADPSAFTRVSALGVEEQRVNVVIGLDALPPGLGDGFRVEARIQIWRGDVPTVPASAIFRDRGRWAVYTVDEGRARLRPVVLGHRGRLDVEIQGGIPEGSVVILHPGDRVRDGARVATRGGAR